MWAELSPASRCSTALLSAPPLHTRSLTHTCFHCLPSPPVAEAVMQRVACCCFDFLALCELWLSSLHQKKGVCVFTDAHGDCICDLRAKSKEKSCCVNMTHKHSRVHSHTYTHTHTFYLTVIATNRAQTHSPSTEYSTMIRGRKWDMEEHVEDSLSVAKHKRADTRSADSDPSPLNLLLSQA